MVEDGPESSKKVDTAPGSQPRDDQATSIDHEDELNAASPSLTQSLFNRLQSLLVEEDDSDLEEDESDSDSDEEAMDVDDEDSLDFSAGSNAEADAMERALNLSVLKHAGPSGSSG